MGGRTRVGGSSGPKAARRAAHLLLLALWILGIPAAAAASHGPRVVGMARAWVIGAPPGRLALTAVDFFAGGTGWVAGSTVPRPGASRDDVLLRTVDGGHTWSRTLIRQVPTLSVLDFLTARVGWAIGGSGCVHGTPCGGQRMVLHTTDGGAIWTVQWRAPAVAGLPLQLHFVAAQVGFALVGGTVWQTRDGGGRWRRVALQEVGLRVSGMSWPDARTGWLVGDMCAANHACQAQVWGTRDGGRRWVSDWAVPADVADGTGRVAFASGVDGWVYVRSAAGQGLVYRTTDGGRAWHRVQTRLAEGPGVAGALVFAPSGVGWLPVASGRLAGVGGVYRTRDGGRSWVHEGARRAWSVIALSVAAPDVAWAIGTRPGAAGDFLVHTTDGGRVWAESGLTLRPTAGVAFVNRRDGFGVGTLSDPNMVLATTDDGGRWVEVGRLPGAARADAVSFADAQGGWALGTSAVTGRLGLYATTDGGRIWRARGPVGDGAAPSGAPWRLLYLRDFAPGRGVMVLQARGETAAAVVRKVAAVGLAHGSTAVRPVAVPLPPGSWGAAGFVSPTSGWWLTVAPLRDQRGRPSRFSVTLGATADGGRHWATLWSEAAAGAPAAALAAAPGGWLWTVLADQGRAGQQETTPGELLRSDDGGRTWTMLRLPAALDLQPPPGAVTLNMMFINRWDGWILSAQGLLATRDGGRVWTWAA